MTGNSFKDFLAVSIICFGFSVIGKEWITAKRNNYYLYYTLQDKGNKNDYQRLLDNGVKSVISYFGAAYKNRFNVFVHSTRNSLDSTWQRDWSMPTFKSECWMVASGVGAKLDLLSPARWEAESCEHTYSDLAKTQQLITHELVHVYHGQLNKSTDFSDVQGLDWFVEGLATYVSGQCDAARLQDVKRAITENKVPAKLDDFWSGKNKYGFSGTLVQFIHEKYGRDKLIMLLPLSRKEEVLNALNTTETELIEGWKVYVLKI